MRLLFAILLCFTTGFLPAFADWTAADSENADAPGRKVDIKSDSRLMARFIYGKGQMKPYLHVYGEEGDLLTEWSADQKYPHHRGIYIGWNRIISDLGTFDLWHLNNGGTMTVRRLEAADGGKNSAKIVASIDWRGGKKDADDLLITETRTLMISRPAGRRTQVDAKFALKAARDVTLGGDLQHAGIHYRASHRVVDREKETFYLWAPDSAKVGAKIAGNDLQWCRLLFPLGERWYTAGILNSPQNPVEELSTRAYGRFGFFFKKSLKAEEALNLSYRFLTEQVEKPAEEAKLSPAQVAALRSQTQKLYDAFVREGK